MPLPPPIPAPSPEAVRKFQALYAQRFGQALTDDEALALATATLHLVYFGTTSLPRPPQGQYAPPGSQVSPEPAPDPSPPSHPSSQSHPS